MINPPLTTSLPIINGAWFSLPQDCRVNILFYQLQTQMLGEQIFITLHFFVEWYNQNVLEQHKISNVNCFTLLDESCHFSKTCTIKITGFKLEDLGLMVLYRMHMTQKFKDFSRKRTIISYFHHPLRGIFEILPTFSHVWKHFISSIVNLMMSWLR